MNNHRTMNKKICTLRIVGALVALVACSVCGCASTYKLISQPDAVSVYHKNGSQRILLGQTPMEFSKSSLPVDAPFVLSFEKSGYEAKELAVTPTDNTKTTISVTMKIGVTAGSDEITKRIRATIGQIFAIQELVYKKRFVDALAALKDLEAREQNLPEVYVLRGSVYYLLKDQAQAKTQWEKALALDPTMESLKVRLLQMQDQEGAQKS